MEQIPFRAQNGSARQTVDFSSLQLARPPPRPPRVPSATASPSKSGLSLPSDRERLRLRCGRNLAQRLGRRSFRLPASWPADPVTTEQRLAAAAAAAPRWHTGQDKCSGALKCLPACPLLSSCLYLRLRAPSLIDRGLVPSATLRVPDLPHARCTYTGWSRQRATRPGSAMCLISVCDAHATRMPHRHTPIPRLRPTRLRKRRCLTHTEMRRCSTLVLPTVTLALANALPFPHRFNPPES